MNNLLKDFKIEVDPSLKWRTFHCKVEIYDNLFNISDHE